MRIRRIAGNLGMPAEIPSESLTKHSPQNFGMGPRIGLLFIPWPAPGVLARASRHPVIHPTPGVLARPGGKKGLRPLYFRYIFVLIEKR